MINILLRDKNLPESGKIPNTYGYKRNRIILNKIKNNLPELMSRNLMLGERLNNKIKVSSFMNNTENKNQKYLKYFVISSGKRVKDLKTGLELKKVIKKGINHLSPICNSINNDLIIKNGDYLIKQKKIINEKTEQETHNKIDELIKGIKHIIKPAKIIKKNSIHKIVKSVSEEDLYKAKNLINNELNSDHKKLRNKINYYIHKLNTIAETKPREFHKVASNLYLKSNLKMINYQKPRSTLIKDSEGSNLLKIRKHLIQSITNQIVETKEKDIEKEKEKEEKLPEFMNFVKPSTSKINNNNDTLNVVKHLSHQNKYLGKKAKTNMTKINSLIDIKLPYCSNYFRTIKYCKNSQKNKSNNLSSNNIYDDNNINKLIDIGFDKENMMDEIKLIKKEINTITDLKNAKTRSKFENFKNKFLDIK